MQKKLLKNNKLNLKNALNHYKVKRQISQLMKFYLNHKMF